MLKNKLTVSSSPHIHSDENTTTIMFDVILALFPALIMSILLFGPRALMLTSISVISCVIFEYITRKIFKRTNTISDLSAVVTGILLAFNLPVSLPWWMVIIGSFIAIVVVKQFFGGIGQNFVNPALVGRLVLMISFPEQMSNWIQALSWRSTIDGITTATPLNLLENGKIPSLSEMFNNKVIPEINPIDMLLGIHSGSLGETCIAALIVGFIYLVIRKVIKPTIPLIYIGTTVVICWFFGQNPIYAAMSGGLVLGAVFMATDYATSPINFKGQVIYAFGCGLITAIIRLFGNLPEGVSVAIILMNILVPHIEHLTNPKPFGYQKTIKNKNNNVNKAEVQTNE